MKNESRQLTEKIKRLKKIADSIQPRPYEDSEDFADEADYHERTMDLTRKAIVLQRLYSAYFQRWYLGECKNNKDYAQMQLVALDLQELQMQIWNALSPSC